MNEKLFVSFGIVGACFLLTLFLTGYLRKILVKHAILDHPNDRSSHKVATPRGGGWALLLVIIPAMILCAILDDSVTAYSGLIAGLGVLVLVSWIDDRKTVPPILRLSIHLLAAFLGSLCLREDQLLFSGHLPFWLDRLITIVGWAWFINLYNFMDGIDGITSVETVSIATGACVIMVAIGAINPFLKTLTLILTGTSLGFLSFNWHPAKIFLGDVGSVPLGFLTGFLLLMPALQGFWAPALIIPLYYLADSGITLVYRAIRGKKIWQAHREHFYQQATQKIRRHDKIVLNIIFINTALLGAAIFSVTHPGAGFALAAAIVANLLEWMHKTGKDDEPSP